MNKKNGYFEEKDNLIVGLMKKGPHHKIKKPKSLSTNEILKSLEEEYMNGDGRMVVDKGYYVDNNKQSHRQDIFLSNPIDENTGLVNPWGFYSLDGVLNSDVNEDLTYKLGGNKNYQVYRLDSTDYIVDKSGNNHFQFVHQYFKGRVKEIFEFGDKVWMIGKTQNDDYRIFDQNSNGAMQKNMRQIKKISYKDINILMFEIAKCSHGEPYEEFIYIGSDGKYYDKNGRNEYVISSNQSDKKILSISE